MLDCAAFNVMASTADELSAAAITRGIENLNPKTCMVDLKFHFKDYLCLLVGGAFIAAAILAH
mgnify:CR=1 FL=1